jgi:hypothetical protein
MSLETVKDLFAAVRANPAHPMNQPRRLMGGHCRARLQRAQAKRRKHPRGMKAYTP